MYIRKCKWCNEEISVEKQPLFALHVANCKLNPSLEKRKKESSLRFKGKQKVDRISFTKKCPKCDTTFEVRATESEIKRSKVRNFCSKSCGNSRVVSEDTKLKIRNTLLKNGNLLYTPDNKGRKFHREKTGKRKSLGVDFICLGCGKIGIDERYKRNRKYHAECWLKISGGVRKGSSRGKCGWYNGFWCDSSYELAFIIFNLENGINFKRNYEGFPYQFQGTDRLFYPDFIIDGIYYEIKNFKSELTDSKIKYFPHEIRVLYREDMVSYLEYAKSKYGKNFTNLYDPQQSNKLQ